MYKIIALLGLCWVIFGSAIADDKAFHLRVVRGTDSLADAGDFDGWAIGSTGVAQGLDKPYDISCPLTFDRSGEVSVSTTIPNVIDSAAQFAQIAQLHAEVFIVDVLKYCGGPPPEGQIFAGCKPGTGAPVLLVNSPSAGLSLIHEIGHKVPRDHTYPTSICTAGQPPGLSEEKFYNVMYCAAHSKRKVLTVADCNGYKGLHFGVAGGPGPEPDLLPNTDEDATAALNILDSVDTPIEEFLIFGFDEGVPFSEIAALTEEEVEQVREAVRSDIVDYWAPGALVLGLRGNAGDAETLIGIAHRAAKLPGAAALRARTTVPDGIALFLERTNVRTNGWLASFLVSNVDIANAQELATERDVHLVARSYLRAAAMTGDLVMAEAAVEIAAQQVERSDNPAVRKALAPEFRNEVANLALQAERLGTRNALENFIEIAPDASESLRTQSLEQPALPQVEELLRTLDIQNGVLRERGSSQ